MSQNYTVTSVICKPPSVPFLVDASSGKSVNLKLARLLLRLSINHQDLTLLSTPGPNYHPLFLDGNEFELEGRPAEEGAGSYSCFLHLQDTPGAPNMASELTG